MKKFIQHITHDPYIDWVVIVFVCFLAIIISSVWSFFVYQDTTIIPNPITSTSTTTKTSIDMEKLEKTVDLFNKKAEIFNSPNLPVIDVRDPSL